MTRGCYPVGCVHSNRDNHPLFPRDENFNKKRAPPPAGEKLQKRAALPPGQPPPRPHPKNPPRARPPPACPPFRAPCRHPPRRLRHIGLVRGRAGGASGVRPHLV